MNIIIKDGCASYIHAVVTCIIRFREKKKSITFAKSNIIKKATNEVFLTIREGQISSE